MRTEYRISGSTSVTFRENGAVHEMVMDETLLLVSSSPTDDSRPDIECHIQILILYTCILDHELIASKSILYSVVY